MNARYQMGDEEGMYAAWSWAQSHGLDWVRSNQPCYAATAQALAAVGLKADQGQSFKRWRYCCLFIFLIQFSAAAKWRSGWTAVLSSGSCCLCSCSAMLQATSLHLGCCVAMVLEMCLAELTFPPGKAIHNDACCRSKHAADTPTTSQAADSFVILQRVHLALHSSARRSRRQQSSSVTA